VQFGQYQLPSGSSWSWKCKTEYWYTEETTPKHIKKNPYKCEREKVIKDDNLMSWNYRNKMSYLQKKFKHMITLPPMIWLTSWQSLPSIKK
jgi:hypothetical protein